MQDGINGWKKMGFQFKLLVLRIKSEIKARNANKRYS